MASVKNNQNPTIMIVDDEEVVLNSHHAVLKKHFDHIIKCSNGSEALQVFQNEHDQGNTIPIVITDYKMPELDGLDLTVGILELEPKTRVLIITAHMTPSLSLWGVKDNVTCLMKPLDPIYLMMAVSQEYQRYLSK